MKTVFFAMFSAFLMAASAQISPRIQPADPPELAANSVQLSDPSIPLRIADIPGSWAVVTTKSRCEKQLAQFCLTNGIPYYLPYALHISTSRNHSLVPLFPSFMFVAYNAEGNEWELSLIRSNRGYFKFIFTSDQPRLRSELALIQSESPERRTMLSEAKFPPEGGLIQFSSGPFADLSGKVIRSDPSKLRLYIELRCLGRKVSFEITDPARLQEMQLVESLA